MAEFLVRRQIEDMKEIRYECMFENGPAGYIQVKSGGIREGTFDFMPYRSHAHLRLVQTIANHGQAEIVLQYNQHAQRMKATAINPRHITLQTDTQ